MQQLTHAHTHTERDTHRQAGKQASLVQLGWPPFEAASRWSKERCRENVSISPSSLGGVGVTGVLAGLRGCGCAAVVGSWWAVEGLCTAPQVLQGLKEGAACPLLLHRRGTFFFYLCNLSKGNRLGFESGLARSTGAAFALSRAFRYRELLGELLHGRGH